MDATTPAQLDPKDRQNIYRFLQKQPVAVLATVDQTGDPQASTIYIGVDETLNTVVFTTKAGTQKYQNIMRNPTVMLVSYDAHDQAAVQIHGKATAVAAGDPQLNAYHQTLMASEHTGPDKVPPIAKISAGEFVAFTVAVDDIWFTQYGHGDSYVNALHHTGDKPSTGDPA